MSPHTPWLTPYRLLALLLAKALLCSIAGLVAVALQQWLTGLALFALSMVYTGCIMAFALRLMPAQPKPGTSHSGLVAEPGHRVVDGLRATHVTEAAP